MTATAVLLMLRCLPLQAPAAVLYDGGATVAVTAQCDPDALAPDALTCDCPATMGGHTIRACTLDVFQDDTTTTVACGLAWDGAAITTSIVTRKGGRHGH